MRAKGLRITRERRLLADVLEDATEHLDAETVFRLARRRSPRIHRSTIYRTLNTFKDLDLIDELDLMHVDGNRHYYEIRPPVFHIHLVCTSCGEVQEPEERSWKEWRARIMKETGFSLGTARLEVGGLCADCRRRARRP
jgi:Fur family ferric uptake transcriptional regulator